MGKGLIAVIAVNNLGFIGKNNTIMWRCSADLKHFKAMTLEAKMVCGYNTYETLPNVVKARTVVLDPRGELFDGEHTFTRLDQSNTVCIGGKKTYEKYAPYLTELHISHINDNQIGDCTFPDLSNLNPECKIFNYYFEINGNQA